MINMVNMGTIKLLKTNFKLRSFINYRRKVLLCTNDRH